MQNEPEKKEEAGASVSDDALASFNKEFKELQEKYQLKAIAIPMIMPDGRIVASIQALPAIHEQEASVESPYNKHD